MREFTEVIKTIKILRSPKGCPWDRKQKVKSFSRYLLEEVYEFLESLEENNLEKIKEELGDLFFILTVLGIMFEEKNKFTLKEVLKIVNEKIVKRHPHVFSKEKIFKTDKEVLNFWIKEKAKYKERKTIRERLPKFAPSLLLAYLFFKENKYLNKNSSFSVSVLLEEIKKSLVNLNKNKNKKIYLEEIIFKLAQLAFYYNLELESILKYKILKTANKIFYNEK